MTNNQLKIVEALKRASEPYLIGEISRITKMHRPAIYRSLRALEADGIVRAKERGRRTAYYLSDRSVTTGREPLIDSSSIASLKTYSSMGLQELYRDMAIVLKDSGIFYRIESPKNYLENDKFLPAEYFALVCQKRVVEKFVITNDRTFKAKPAQLERYVRALRPVDGEFAHDVTMILYGDKFALLDFQKEQAIVWQNADVVAFFKDIFSFMLTTLPSTKL